MRVWPWPDSLDALVAAPRSHQLRLENDAVRVVEVVIAPGAREPFHTHRWPSVMVVYRAAAIRYYGELGTAEFESRRRSAGTTETAPLVEWLGPEGLHAVENIDTAPYHAVRVELKEPISGPRMNVSGESSGIIVDPSVARG